MILTQGVVLGVAVSFAPATAGRTATLTSTGRTVAALTGCTLGTAIASAAPTEIASLPATRAFAARWTFSRRPDDRISCALDGVAIRFMGTWGIRLAISTRLHAISKSFISRDGCVKPRGIAGDGDIRIASRAFAPTTIAARPRGFIAAFRPFRRLDVARVAGRRIDACIAFARRAPALPALALTLTRRRLRAS